MKFFHLIVFGIELFSFASIPFADLIIHNFFFDSSFLK